MAQPVELVRSGPASTEALGSRIAQGVFRTLAAACPMAEVVFKHWYDSSERRCLLYFAASFKKLAGCLLPEGVCSESGKEWLEIQGIMPA